MMNVAELAWEAFSRYDITGLTVNRSEGWIDFRQKDEQVRSERRYCAALWSIPMCFAGLFFMLATFRTVPWTAVAPIVGFIAPFFVLPFVFIPSRTLEVRKGMVTFSQGFAGLDETRIPVDEIQSISVTPTSVYDGEGGIPHGWVTIWHGRYPVQTLLVHASVAGAAMQGVQAAIGLMNPSPSENPNPATGIRRRQFPE